jgi:hypothetical protein
MKKHVEIQEYATATLKITKAVRKVGCVSFRGADFSRHCFSPKQGNVGRSQRYELHGD